MATFFFFARVLKRKKIFILGCFWRPLLDKPWSVSGFVLNDFQAFSIAYQTIYKTLESINGKCPKNAKTWNGFLRFSLMGLQNSIFLENGSFLYWVNGAFLESARDSASKEYAKVWFLKILNFFFVLYIFQKSAIFLKSSNVLQNFILGVELDAESK